MYKQIGTILGNSFVIDDNVELFWVTFDQSVATLSINTLCSRYTLGYFSVTSKRCDCLNYPRSHTGQTYISSGENQKGIIDA